MVRSIRPWFKRWWPSSAIGSCAITSCAPRRALNFQWRLTEEAVAPTTMSAAAELDFSRIRAELRQIISDVIGANVDEIDDEAPLLDYVTSSLALLEGIRRVYERFGVLIPIRPLLEGAGNLRALSAFIDQALEGQEKSVQAVLPNGPEKVEA